MLFARSSYVLQEDCHRYTGGPRATSPRRGPMPESSSTPTSTTGLQRLSRSQPHEVSVRCDRVPGQGCPHGPVGVKLLSSLVGGVLTRLVVVHSTPSRSLQQSRIFSGTMADISSFAVEPTRSVRYPPHRCLPRLVKAARLQFVNHLLFGAIILTCTSTPSLDIKIKERATSWQVPPILYN